MLNRLSAEACMHGDRLAAISTRKLLTIKHDFDLLGIDTSPYYSFEPPADSGFSVCSVLVIASPSATFSVSFEVNSNQTEVIIPAGYRDQENRKSIIRDYLSDIIENAGFHISDAKSLPCKPIAVHAGLGLLGRNNLLYVDNMGSFLNIYLYYSDIPVEDEPFYELRGMDFCDRCGRCVSNCPTGALTPENALVNIDRCLTAHNEHAGPFPDWIKPEWHNALIGCLKCQISCPENKQFIDSIARVASFHHEQTLAFLDGDNTILEQLGLTHYQDVLSRNLKALLNRP